MSETAHLHPTAPLADRVLLPGDPGRAMRLAQELIDGPKMFNHNRGLWGYTGPAKLDGEPLSVQSTGIGGPSAAIVIHELVVLGAQELVRVGTCGALAEGLSLGDLLVAGEAIPLDGASRALGAGERVAADPVLTEALQRARRSCGDAGAGPASGAVVSTDLFYDDSGQEPAWRERGALAVEMECATLFTLAAALGVRAAAVLLVTDIILPSRRRIELEAIQDGELRLGRLAADALAAQAPPSR